MLTRRVREIAVFLAAISLAGCSSAASTTAPTTAAANPPASSVAPVASASAPAATSAAVKANSAYPICLLSQASDTPYSSALNKAAAAEALVVGVKLTVLSAEMDAQKQAAQMDTCIAQGVKGVIVVAADAKAIVPSIKKAHDAGIKVLIENAPVDPSADPYTIGFSGPGDYKMAHDTAGPMAAKYLSNGGNIAVIEGTAGYGPTIARLQGFEDYLKDYPNIHIIDTQYADWSRQKAIQISADQLTRFGTKINLFYTMDDDMAIGVAQSIQAANSSAKIVSLTAFPDSCPLIQSGIIIGTAIQSGATDGTLAVDVITRALNGETVPRENWMDTPALTKDNLDQCPKS